MTHKGLPTFLIMLSLLTPCASAKDEAVFETPEETAALQTLAAFAQTSVPCNYRTEVSQAYIGDFGELVQPNTTVSRDELSSDPFKYPDAQTEAKQKAKQDTQLPPKPDAMPNAHIEYTLAMVAAEEKHPEQADAHFREAVAAQRCGKYDRKLEAQIMSAYAKFLKSQHRLTEAKEIMTQLRTSRRKNHLLE